MLIDSHCHWDAPEFGEDSVGLMAAARELGVGGFVIPAVERSNWSTVAQLAEQVTGAVFTLGIHPLYVGGVQEGDLQALRGQVELSLKNPKFVGIGEIGLDYFVPDLDPQLQWHIFTEQLKIARDFELPVVLHVRRSQDMVLKGIRQFKPSSGIAHAFNGSEQQAQLFLKYGFCLGFGGAMTYTRALQIRRLAIQLPLDGIVLETDAPDIAPEWINHQRNDSSHLPQIAQTLSDLRRDAAPLEQALEVEALGLITSANVMRVLPRAALVITTA